MAKNPLPAATPDDGDDVLSALRIDQRHEIEAVGVKKLLTTVPIRKPAKTDWYRMHPEHSLDCYMLELKSEREVYFVTPDVATVVAEFVTRVRLRMAVTKQGVVFVWPLRLPDGSRRRDHWQTSAEESAAHAVERWTQTAADMRLGAYVTRVAVADFGEPRWPEEPWNVVLKIALQGRQVSTADHPVILDLLGRS